MAIVTTKSTLVSNFEADPPAMNPARDHRGRLRVGIATVEVAAADDDGSVYAMIPVHSSWRIQHAWLYNDTITGGTSFDLGLHETAANGGGAASAAAYASAVDLSSARTAAPVDAAFEARDIANVGRQVWQDAGQSADPNKHYVLALKGNTVGTAAGTITLVVEFAENA